MGAAKDLKKYELQTSQLDAREMGEFAYKLLVAVAEYRFDDSLKIMTEYRTPRTHPVYKKKTERLFEHCEELILAIKAKKTFPNLTSLAQNKQEELHEKARAHWEELRSSLRRLRMIERQIALEDARSTVWVVKAFAFSTFALLTIFLFQEAIKTLGAPLMILLEEIGEKILKLLGL